MKKTNILLIGLGAAVGSASAFFFKKKKKPAEPEKPPKKAPQVKVDNPGDQSDFPTAASDSEVG